MFYLLVISYDQLALNVYLFESILACFSPRSSLLVWLDDAWDAGYLVEEVELAVEERVGRPVEALDDDSSAKQNKISTINPDQYNE